MAFKKGEPQPWRQRGAATVEVVETVENPVSEPAQASEGGEVEAKLIGALAAFDEALEAAKADKEREAQVVAQLEKVLSKLTVKDFPQLADNPVVEKFLEKIDEAKAKDERIRAGAITGKGLAVSKKPWTWQDVNRLIAEGRMEVVEYTCPENIAVIWNGLRYSFVADVPVRVPSPFRDVYLEARKARRFGQQNAAFLMKKAEAVHPDMVIPEAVIARGSGDMGHYLPGGGLIAGAQGAAVGEGGEAVAAEGAGGEAA